MGISGLILRKINKLNLEETKTTLTAILDRCGCRYKADLCTSNYKGCSYNYYFISAASHKPKKCSFVMYVYGEGIPEYKKGDFEWIDNDLTAVINIEDISGCEETLIRLLYEYFKYYPDDYFYDEFEWHYNKENIDKIHNSQNYSGWCYRKP